MKFFLALPLLITSADAAPRIFFYPFAACVAPHGSAALICNKPAGQCCTTTKPYSSVIFDYPEGAGTVDIYGSTNCEAAGTTGLGQTRCHSGFGAIHSAKWHPIDFDGPLKKRDCENPDLVQVVNEDGSHELINIPKRHYAEIETAVLEGGIKKIRALAGLPRRLT